MSTEADMTDFAVLRLAPVLLMITSVFFTACDPRQLPGFKQEGKRQEERITRETDEAIKKSPLLQELDRLCTQELPRPDGFVPVNKYRDFNEEKFLGYGYHSELDYQSVKSFYVNHLTQHGWQLTEQKDEGWGQRKIEFRNEKYRVTIFDMGGGKGTNYALNCGTL
jgi:hypothetical protein